VPHPVMIRAEKPEILDRVTATLSSLDDVVDIEKLRIVERAARNTATSLNTCTNENGKNLVPGVQRPVGPAGALASLGDRVLAGLGTVIGRRMGGQELGPAILASARASDWNPRRIQTIRVVARSATRLAARKPNLLNVGMGATEHWVTDLVAVPVSQIEGEFVCHMQHRSLSSGRSGTIWFAL
jgi:hypothetical protein